jgi:uncharacterized repeat protein (TIGR03803 family)
MAFPSMNFDVRAVRIAMCALAGGFTVALCVPASAARRPLRASSSCTAFTDGANPPALVNAGGTLYGTTAIGGAKAAGTIFSIRP